MTGRVTDPNFVGQVTTVLGETGRPVGIQDVAAGLSARYRYELNDDLVADIRNVVKTIVL